MSHRARLASVLWRTQALRVLPALRTPPLLVLAYHRVMPIPEPEEAHPFDIELVSATPAEFAWQVDHIATHCSPVSMAQVVDWVLHGAALPPRPVLVTFDDGFDDNYHYAFPILRDRGVPGTIFVATDLTGREGSVWYEQVAYALVNGPITLPLPGKLAAQVASGAHPGWGGGAPCARRQLLAAVLDELKNETVEANRAYVAMLNAAYPVRAEHAALSRMLDWQQVAEMANGGIDFGSHGASHALLSRLPPAELVDELVRSRAALESATGQAVRTIAYPVGSRRAFDERVLDAVSACGYVAGFSYLPGIAGASADTPLALPRLHVERYTTRAMFAAMLSLPEVFR